MISEVNTIRIDRIVFQQTLEKKLADLPPLPAVVTRIMRTINSPTTGADELSRLIALDQGLSSKILRIVNSAYYGFPKRISTITHAVVILGFNTVRNLVLGVSAFGMLPQKAGSSGLNRTKFWEHSVATAVAASVIAKRRRPATRSIVEEAFVAGLLHDIGKLFLDCYFPVQFAVCTAFASREGISQVEAERRVLEIDHTMVGQRIAEHWNFPPSLVNAIGTHHEPQPTESGYDIAAIIHAADWIAWQVRGNAGSDAKAPTLLPAVEAWLGYSEAEYAALLADWERQFASAHDLLQLGNSL